MADAKYLNDSGLTRTWSRIKTYLSSNYSTKSELTSGLAGKANTSHTHTSSQITDLNTKTGNMKSIGSYAVTGGSTSSPVTLASIAINDFKTFTSNSYAKFKLPSGGQYLIISNVSLTITAGSSKELGAVNVAAGGSTVFTDFSYSSDTRKGFYFRIS